jgi:hypothetical protein
VGHQEAAMMTLEDMQAEIASLRQEQDLQRKHWRHWGFTASISGLILVLIMLLIAASKGTAPSPAMLFVVLTFIFMGLAFGGAGRGYRFF